MKNRLDISRLVKDFLESGGWQYDIGRGVCDDMLESDSALDLPRSLIGDIHFDYHAAFSLALEPVSCDKDRALLFLCNYLWFSFFPLWFFHHIIGLFSTVIDSLFCSFICLCFNLLYLPLLLDFKLVFLILRI